MAACACATVTLPNFSTACCLARRSRSWNTPNDETADPCCGPACWPLRHWQPLLLLPPAGRLRGPAIGRTAAGPDQPAPSGRAPWIRVGVGSQTLTLFDGDGTPRRHWVVSTAKNGRAVRSYQTPRGWHTVCDKIGADAARMPSFTAAKIPAGATAPNWHAKIPDKDWIPDPHPVAVRR